LSRRLDIDVSSFDGQFGLDDSRRRGTASDSMRFHRQMVTFGQVVKRYRPWLRTEGPTISQFLLEPYNIAMGVLDQRWPSVDYALKSIHAVYICPNPSTAFFVIRRQSPSRNISVI
jgi:hypothetical protein